MKNSYQIAFIGHYTKDTIVSVSGTRVVNGGAFNYGANVAARMNLEVQAVTMMSSEDSEVVSDLEKLGVKTDVTWTPESTCLKLVYPSDNPDERVIYVSSWAGPFTLREVNVINAEVIVVGASMREEIPLTVVKMLAQKDSILAADIQSFLRVNDNGKLIAKTWPEKEEILSCIDVLKTDAVEAEILTGEKDIKKAATLIRDLGPKEVIITHKDGVLVFAEEKFHQALFYPRELIGRSGRGDTCIASYMAKRINSSPQESTIWAAAVTSLKMEAEGPFRRSIDEVETLIQEKY
ncbi:MAG: PfkB family carbohydrate kinase [Atribacterota bacterium]|nr:PfkB family carbohydrate kinase [Atribacterota bacterium]